MTEISETPLGLTGIVTRANARTRARVRARAHTHTHLQESLGQFVRVMVKMACDFCFFAVVWGTLILSFRHPKHRL